MVGTMLLEPKELRDLIYKILNGNPHGRDYEVAIEIVVEIIAREAEQELMG